MKYSKSNFNEVKEKTKCEVENLINDIIEDELKPGSVDLLGKLVDIHADLANEDYWKKKEEVMEMNYRGEYGNYGRRGVPGSGRGRYSEGSYGRRGVKGTGRGRYRAGEEMMDEMAEHYGNYSEGKEEMNMGNYGAENATLKSLDYMLQSVTEFIEMLQDEASSQEEIHLIKKYTKKISEM